MRSVSNLPGLDRLLSVCQEHSLPMERSPPLASAPKAGELFLGEPFDPQLATVYERLGSAEIGPLTLLGPHSGEQGLLPKNEWLRQYDYVQAHSTHFFGRMTGYAYYCGAVPRLANAQGLQPVVYMDCHETIFSVPIASSVDRFFHLFSRYLELLVAEPGYGQSGAMNITFPWGLAQYVARDEPLMEHLHAGHFDFPAENHRDAEEWYQRLRTARP